MRMRISVAAVFVFVLVSGLACFGSALTCGLAQAQAQVGSLPDSPRPAQVPARDPRARPTTGTGAIRGHIVDGQTGQPLVHVRVRLSGIVGNQPPTAITDDSGGFEFTRLPAGSFFLQSYKAGYIQGNYPEMGRTLRSTGKPIALNDGQVVGNLTVPIYRSGAITGRVLDVYGDPLETVNLQVVAAPGSGAPRTLASTNTNDAGEFRLGRLPAGAYLVVATSNGGGRPFAESEAGLVPTYYPGVTSPDQAQPIVLERGQTITGIEFQVMEQPVTLVTGIVIDSTGQPSSGGNVHATSVNGFMNDFNAGGAVKSDGTFELKLTPGNYRIDAYAQRREVAKDGTTRPSGQNDAPQQQGFARFTVGSEPVLNLVVNTGPGATITGRIVFDGEGPPPDPTRLTVTAQTLRNMLPTSGGGRGDECRATRAGKLNPADLTFTLEGVYGTCVLNINTGALGRWLLRSAMYRDVDLIDRPIDLTNQQSVRDVQVLFTTRRSDVSAEVTDEHGASSQDYVLLAFSADKNRWPLYRYSATAIRSSGSPNQTTAGPMTSMAMLSLSNGAVMAPNAPFPPTDPGLVARARSGVINWLPPGDYYVVALDDIVIEDVHDPAYLEQLVPNATRVALREGEAQALQLRRVKAPPSVSQRTPR